MNLLLSDIAIDNGASLSHIQIILKQSKGDQFTKVHKYAWEELLMQYVPYRLRYNVQDSFFLFSDSIWLTRDSFSTALNEALQEPWMDCSQCNTHSFRIGAATSPKQVAISDSDLKALGRWRSDAYQIYVRLSPQGLAGFSKSLAYTQRAKLTQV